MHEPMAANTLAESALWLTEASGRVWSDRQVLDAVICRTEVGAVVHDATIMTCLFVLPPKFTAFGFYRDSPSESGPVFQRLLLSCKFPLSLDCALELFDHHESRVACVKHGSAPDHIVVLAEPTDVPLRVTLDMVRIGKENLIELYRGIESKACLQPMKFSDYARTNSGTDEENRNATWWSLRLLAVEYEWGQSEAWKLINKCLGALPAWDGSILKILKSGPGPSISSGAQSRTAPANISHRLKQRLHILDAEIVRAKGSAADSESPPSVFAELVKLAEIRFGCLLGVDEQSIKYQKGEEVAFFKLKDLRDRMSRAKAR